LLAFKHPGKPVLDLEALGRLDVLELDGAERGSNRCDGPDDLLGVFRIDEDRDAVHTDERVEQGRLPFHDRHPRHRPDVPQAQDGRSVGDDCNRIVDRGVVVRPLRIFADELAYFRDAGRIDLPDGRYPIDLHRRLDAYLPAAVQLEDRIDDVGNDGALDLPDLLKHRLEMGLVVHIHGDVAGVVLEADPDEPDVSHGRIRLPDGGGNLAHVPRLVEDHQADLLYFLVDSLLDLHGHMVSSRNPLCQIPEE
jgi:hypothetical protein